MVRGVRERERERGESITDKQSLAAATMTMLSHGGATGPRDTNARTHRVLVVHKARRKRGEPAAVQHNIVFHRTQTRYNKDMYW